MRGARARGTGVPARATSIDNFFSFEGYGASWIGLTNMNDHGRAAWRLMLSPFLLESVFSLLCLRGGMDHSPEMAGKLEFAISRAVV